MSIWTHVNASFRIDNLGPQLTKEELEKIIGKQYSWEDDYYDFHNENGSPKFKLLPCGSEGSLKYNIWRNKNEHCIAGMTVNVFGDLRDYSNMNELEEWFKDCCKHLWIRQAVMQVEIECMEQAVFACDGENFTKHEY